jgi:bifunctional UDP-N-acetylglucosamine pyrophosphorylase/glucosamine-1-phosphate N-acetyltransferase
VATWKAVILAAGQGKRMRSRLPKPLHLLAGKPILIHLLEQVETAGFPHPIVVIPSNDTLLREALHDRAEMVVQQTPSGTGDALISANNVLRDDIEHCVILNADLPLLRSQTISNLVDSHELSTASMTFLTTCDSLQTGLGRIIRKPDGEITKIVEDQHATAKERLITEVNGGVYAFRLELLRENLAELKPSSNGELYLTDLVSIATKKDQRIRSLLVSDPIELLGINNRVDLSEAELALGQRTRTYWMLHGVTLIDPQSTFIESTVTIGNDTVVHPNTHIRGQTIIGTECSIGPNSIVTSSRIGNKCNVIASVIEHAILEERVGIGPFSHLRPDTYVEEDSHIGNYVEVKGSRLGSRIKVGHFSYLGDASIGRDVNIGAGTVTCNYDGSSKQPTTIGDGVLIGSDTMLVAPVKIGDKAITGAGAVVTDDVPANAVVVGVPARIVNQAHTRSRRIKRR